MTGRHQQFHRDMFPKCAFDNILLISLKFKFMFCIIVVDLVFVNTNVLDFLFVLP
jgi:hypothetical protein